MTKPPKRPRDPNQLAKFVVEAATGNQPAAVLQENAMSALGRQGGLVGGIARAASLTPEQRSEIARTAAKKRWGKSDDGSSGT